MSVLSFKEIQDKVGSVVMWTVADSFSIKCKVVDYKHVFGNHRWKIEPVEGTGATYVQTDSITWL
jgi:hypothetical protein|tara:strand:- start:4107 stop:4301 length:195 start_codon:yes stop_codon:yes gene_type:complete